MTPFDRHNLSTSQASYNFHLSSLRINIKCAFGTLSCAFSLLLCALSRCALCHVCALSLASARALSLSHVCSRGCVAGALCQRWGILWRRLQCDFMLQPKVISLCTKLHNFCNKHARDALRNGASERPPACDASFDLEK